MNKVLTPGEVLKPQPDDEKKVDELIGYFNAQLKQDPADNLYKVTLSWPTQRQLTLLRRAINQAGWGIVDEGRGTMKDDRLDMESDFLVMTVEETDR